MLPFDHFQRDPQALQQWHAFIVKENAGLLGPRKLKAALDLSYPCDGNNQAIS